VDRSKFKRRLSGYIATGIVILVTSFWTLWGVGEMYYEGWGLPFPEPMRYLIPGAVCLALTLVALTWPRFGGCQTRLVVLGVDSGRVVSRRRPACRRPRAVYPGRPPPPAAAR
jgi:hypothetical protein